VTAGIGRIALRMLEEAGAMATDAEKEEPKVNGTGAPPEPVKECEEAATGR